MASLHVEFIDEYIREGYDYEFYDNHGRLIRCKDCSFYGAEGDELKCFYHHKDMSANDYCSKAMRRRD